VVGRQVVCLFPGRDVAISRTGNHAKLRARSTEVSDSPGSTLRILDTRVRSHRSSRTQDPVSWRRCVRYSALKRPTWHGVDVSEVTEQQTTYISAEMLAAVGREVQRAVSYPVSESDIRRWAIAVYYPAQPSRRFWEAEAAAASRYGGIVAPEDFNPVAWMTATPRG
jgi:hypothetical protein